MVDWSTLTFRHVSSYVLVTAEAKSRLSIKTNIVLPDSLLHRFHKTISLTQNWRLVDMANLEKSFLIWYRARVGENDKRDTDRHSYTSVMKRRGNRTVFRLGRVLPGALSNYLR